jgi:hypothetical protein
MTKMNMFGSALVAGALSLPMAAVTSAQAPPVVIGGGLVNVQIVDVIDDVEVTVQDINVNVNAAVQIAAALCGIPVTVIGQQLQQGPVTCDVENGPADFVTITP